MKKLNPSHYRAALYMRLSKDDVGAYESSSISTQRKMLRTYAKENHFLIYDEYIDDGWTGTNFERPDFKRMIQDILDKNVNLVITKDLSRLGRDYIMTGQYTEIFFPTNNVRYIAINDGYDSNSPYTDIAPFMNVVNELYARDTSKKIRSAFITKMEEGCFVGNFAPYGYKKSPDNKNKLVIDEDVAPIVRKMFELAASGQNPKAIADFLNNEGIITPAVYRCQKHPYLDISNYTQRKEWTSGSVSKMLKNKVYLGHMAQGKTTKVSFKSKATITNEKDDWYVVENTHEPIISKEIFDIVRRSSQSRTCIKKGKFCNIFSGIAKCKDCGKNMSAVGTKKKGSPANLACGSYKLYGSSECSNHFIDYNILYDIVLKAIHEQIKITKVERDDLIDILKNQREENSDLKISQKSEYNQLKKREKEIDQLIEKLYEDNLQGLINSERLYKLLAKYEQESNQITKRLEAITKNLEQQKDDTQGAIQRYEKFNQLVREYIDIQELTPEILFKLIDRIEIGQGYYEKIEGRKVKHQDIHIFFRFIGETKTQQYIV